MATATRKRNRVRNSVAKRKAKALEKLRDWKNPNRYRVEVHEVPKSAGANWKPKKDQKPVKILRDGERYDSADDDRIEFNKEAKANGLNQRAFIVKDEWMSWAESLASDTGKCLESVRRIGESCNDLVLVRYRDGWRIDPEHDRGFEFTLSVDAEVNLFSLKGVEAEALADYLLTEAIHNAEELRGRVRRAYRERLEAEAKGGAA